MFPCYLGYCGRLSIEIVSYFTARLLPPAFTRFLLLLSAFFARISMVILFCLSSRKALTLYGLQWGYSARPSASHIDMSRRYVVRLICDILLLADRAAIRLALQLEGAIKRGLVKRYLLSANCCRSCPGMQSNGLGAFSDT